jgi:hypothetical protein
MLDDEFGQNEETTQFEYNRGISPARGFFSKKDSGRSNGNLRAVIGDLRGQQSKLLDPNWNAGLAGAIPVLTRQIANGPV